MSQSLWWEENAGFCLPGNATETLIIMQFIVLGKNKGSTGSFLIALYIFNRMK